MTADGIVVEVHKSQNNNGLWWNIGKIDAVKLFFFWKIKFVLLNYIYIFFFENRLKWVSVHQQSLVKVNILQLLCGKILDWSYSKPMINCIIIESNCLQIKNHLNSIQSKFELFFFCKNKKKYWLLLFLVMHNFLAFLEKLLIV